MDGKSKGKEGKEHEASKGDKVLTRYRQEESSVELRGRGKAVRNIKGSEALLCCVFHVALSASQRSRGGGHERKLRRRQRQGRDADTLVWCCSFTLHRPPRPSPRYGGAVPLSASLSSPSLPESSSSASSRNTPNALSLVSL